MTYRFDALHGNEGLKGTLSRHLAAGTLSHAYILEGPEGSGRHTLASLLTASLACESEDVRPCGKCRRCRKIAERICPDFITVGLPKDRRQIPVDSIRALKEEAYITPNDLDFKVFVIENAECMNPAAQNALLKVLEEPPEGVRFFLLTDCLPALLPTVRSRAPVLKLQVFDEETLSSLLSGASPKFDERMRRDPEGMKRLLRTACGSYGAALSLLAKRASGSGNGSDRIADLLQRFLSPSQGTFVLSFTDRITKREEYQTLLEDLQAALRDLLAARRAPDAPLLFFTEREQAAELAGALPLRTLYGALTVLEEALAENSANINLNSSLLMTAEKLWMCKQ